MSARERCRAKRLQRRQNEREILAATGAVIRSAIPVAMYNAGHRKTRKEAVHIVK